MHPQKCCHLNYLYICLQACAPRYVATGENGTAQYLQGKCENIDYNDPSADYVWKPCLASKLCSTPYVDTLVKYALFFLSEMGGAGVGWGTVKECTYIYTFRKFTH